MTIDTIHFEVKLNGIKLADETIPVQLKQAHNSIDTVEIPIHLSIERTRNVIENLEGQDSTIRTKTILAHLFKTQKEKMI